MKPFRMLVLAIAALFLAGCVSADLTKKNLSNVRALVPAVQSAGMQPPANAESTAAALDDAAGTLNQVLSLGVDEGLAGENLSNVRVMSEAIKVSGADDPAPGAVDVATEIARQAGATAALNAAVSAVATPWWVPITAILGSLGAAFTASKTLRRVWTDKHKAADESSEAAASS